MSTNSLETKLGEFVRTYLLGLVIIALTLLLASAVLKVAYAAIPAICLIWLLFAYIKTWNQSPLVNRLRDFLRKAI